MEPRIVDRETITVLGVQARLTHMEEGVPEMWEKHFMAYHDRIMALSTDKVYYGCAFSTDRPEHYDYLAGMAVPPSTAVPEGLTLREIPGGPYVRVECTIATQDDGFDLVENEWIPASAYEKDESRPVLDCYPPGSVSGDSPMYLYFPIVKRTT
jgi:predicted transcriptional regulator YdeE